MFVFFTFFLNSSPQEDELEEVHEEAAQEGQSDQIPRDEKVNTHFVCLS